MKRTIVLLAVFLMMSCSSTKQKKSQDSTKGITWIKEYIKEAKKSPFPVKTVITQYSYKGETVYMVDDCYQCPDAMTTVYNVKKEVLCTFGGMVPETNNTCPDFEKEAKKEKVVWKSFE